MNQALEMAFIRHQNRLEGAHVQIQRAIDDQCWWMHACILGALLIVPLPFTVVGLLRASKRLRNLKEHAEQIAAAAPTVAREALRDS